MFARQLSAAHLVRSYSCVYGMAAAARCHSRRFYATPGKVKVTVTSIADEKTKTVECPLGMTLMEAIVNVAKFDMEAACDGTCACSTCHVVFTPESYAKLAEPPSEDEMDMLDLAPAVTRTSRLSCQVTLTPALDGIAVTIPTEVENQMS